MLIQAFSKRDLSTSAKNTMTYRDYINNADTFH